MVPTAPASAGTYAAVLQTINPHLAQAKRALYAQTLLGEAKRQHVDPSFVMAIVTVESHWNSRAVSRTGAEGLGQIEPATARALGVNPFSIHGGLRGTSRYLHQLLSVFRNAREPIRAAIAGYNAGPGAVRRSGGGVPHIAETQHYVVKVMAAWKMIRSRVAADPEVATAAERTPPGPPRAPAVSDTTYWGQ